MSNGITITGLDELMEKISNMEISEQKERKALNIAGDIIMETVQDNSPNVTGATEKSIKKTITRYDGDLACKIEVKHWSKWFTEYGSSKNKKYIGWFSNSVNDAMPDVIDAIKEVILHEK